MDAKLFDPGREEYVRMAGEVVELLWRAVEAERSEPVFRTVSGVALEERLAGPLPRAGAPLASVLAEFRDEVLPHGRRNGHPRFFGYVCTSADPLGAFGDALASVMNQPVTAWRSAPGAATIERLVVRWLDELTGFGGGGSGILTSGGSSANFHALASAVIAAERGSGLAEGSRHRLAVYLSREGHVSLRKAARLLGVPPAQIRLVEIDERRRMRLGSLRDAVERDLASGLVPAVVCTSAGTANTGAIDPLDEVADYCVSRGIWHHIDGSYGAPAVLTAAYGWLARAFARADSLSLDPHKWLFVPPDAGCVLVRDANALPRAFSQYSEYTAVTETDPIERFAFFDHGLEMSRRFRGLKIWLILKVRGVDAIRDRIAHDIALRRHLDARVAAEPRLEALGSELSIACFRYVPDRAVTDEECNAINAGIQQTIVREGRCYLSPTELDGRLVLRVCIVNFRTESADIDFLIDEVLRIGGAAAER